MSLFLLYLSFLFACQAPASKLILAAEDPNFSIIPNEEGILKKCNRMVEVFGINIFAVPQVEDEKLLHAANVLAQYLDNDEDGEADNPKVLEEMLKQ